MRKLKKVLFKKNNICESAAYISNPACGWYRIYTFRADVTFDPETLYGCIMAEETVALIIIDIGAYKGCELDESSIRNIKNILEWFYLKGKDIILRIVYDNEGKGMENEPSLYPVVKTHMKQIACELKDVQGVYIFQGLLVGSWGEMHNSKYLNKEMLCELSEIFLRDNPDIYMAVRSPKYWRYLHGSEEVVSGTDKRVGIFNDGIMGSATDLGTYSEVEQPECDWLQAWTRPKELEFMKKIADKAVVGGEVIYPESEVAFNPDEQISYLQNICATYLNCVHDKRLLDIWRETPCNKSGIWKDSSVFDYIGCHLGYRFVVKNVSVKIKRDRLKIKLEIRNDGFARLYQEAQLYTQIISDDREDMYINDNINLSAVKCNDSVVTEYEIPIAKGDIYIGIRRKCDGKAIRFANKSELSDKLKLGTLTIS